MKNPDFTMAFLLVAALVNASIIFVYCLFGIPKKSYKNKFQNYFFHFNSIFVYPLGQLATESYEQISDSLYESNWQRLSSDLQKYIILMIRNMNIPLVYHGFDVFVLNLTTFTAVIT